jgi:hypothetical protein
VPFIPAAGAMDCDASKRRVVIGNGFVENVAPAIRNYEISVKTALDQWFSYRRRWIELWRGRYVGVAAGEQKSGTTDDEPSP